MRIDPKQMHAYNYRGNAYLEKKEYVRAVKDFDEAIRRDPKNGFSFGSRANALAKRKSFEQAARDFKQALELDSKQPWILRDNAKFRATASDAKYRDGKKAVEMALQAVEFAGKDADWNYHAALAAAYAESGEFDKAVTAQKRVCADKSLDAEDRAEMEKRLKLYEQKKPFHEQ